MCIVPCRIGLRFLRQRFFHTGREDIEVAEATMQSASTTTVSTVVGRDRKTVSKPGKPQVHKSGTETPYSTLSSTDYEVVYLSGAKVPSYVRPVPLFPHLRPTLRPF